MKYTNLSDLLKGICDAIRDKKGTTGAIKHQDIPSEIASIKTQSQDVLSLASGITSYTESFTIDGEERPNVLDGPSDFSNEDKVIWGTVEATTKHYTHSIQNIDGAENGVAAVITSTSVKNSNYSNVFWFNTTVDSSTSNNKTYLLAIRAKASRQITSDWPMYMYYYYPIGSTASSWHGAFSFKPTTEWKIFYAIVNIPNDKYMYDNTISFCNHGDGTTYYIDWMAAYDITGLNFDHMTFGANATVYSSDVVKGKSFYKDGVLYTGSMVSYTKEETTKSLGRTTTSYTIPAGKHSGSGTVSLNIDSTYNSATPTSATLTYSPNGDAVFTSFTVNGDSDLVASNIKSGVSIFGVTGSYSGGKTYVGETYGTFPEADVCYGWADGSYDYLVTSSNVIYVPIDSAHVNVVPTSVSIIRRNEGTNGLIAALYKGSSNGSGLRMIADDSDEFAIGREGTGYFEFYWYGNNLLINIDEAILNSERYWYAVSYS